MFSLKDADKTVTEYVPFEIAEAFRLLFKKVLV